MVETPWWGPLAFVAGGTGGSASKGMTLWMETGLGNVI